MSQTSYQAALPHDIFVMCYEVLARLAHEPSRLGATRLLYPTMCCLLYIVVGILSMFFLDDEVAGG